MLYWYQDIIKRHRYLYGVLKVIMARSRADLKKLPVSLTPEQYKWLRDKAHLRVVPMSEIIRELVKAEMNRENPQGRLV
jgi:hypothetical protein